MWRLVRSGKTIVDLQWRYRSEDSMGNVACAWRSRLMEADGRACGWVEVEFEAKV